MIPGNTAPDAADKFPTADDLGNPDFWRQLLPEFSITEQPLHAAQGDYRLSDRQTERALEQIRKEGYFQTEPVISAQCFEPLARAIADIDQAHVLPVFIAVYDRLWQFLHSLRHTFRPLLGEKYRLTPDFWAWHITPSDTRQGWSAHRDATLDGDPAHVIREDGSPRLCTIWIPLTDVTTHNSCIYVLPFPHDPGLQAFLRRESPADIQQRGMTTRVSDMRALPARAGSLLGWSPYIVHWGDPANGQHMRG